MTMPRDLPTAPPDHIWISTPLWCCSPPRRAREARDTLWMAAALRGGVVVNIDHYMAPAVREEGKPPTTMHHACALVRLKAKTA